MKYYMPEPQPVPFLIFIILIVIGGAVASYLGFIALLVYAAIAVPAYIFIRNKLTK